MKPHAFFARAALVCAASGLLAACGGDGAADENGNNQPPASPTPAKPSPNLAPTKASSAGSTWHVQNHAATKQDIVCESWPSLSGTGSMYVKQVVILEPVAGSKDVLYTSVASWHEDSACQGSPVAENVTEMVRRYQKTDGAPIQTTVSANGVTTKLDGTTMFDFYEMVSRIDTVRNLKTGATEVIRRGLNTNLEFSLPCDKKDRTIAGLHFDGTYFEDFMCTEKADKYYGVSHVASYMEPTGNTLFEMRIFSNWRGKNTDWQGPEVLFRVQ